MNEDQFYEQCNEKKIKINANEKINQTKFKGFHPFLKLERKSALTLLGFSSVSKGENSVPLDQGYIHVGINKRTCNASLTKQSAWKPVKLPYSENKSTAVKGNKIRTWRPRALLQNFCTCVKLTSLQDRSHLSQVGVQSKQNEEQKAEVLEEIPSIILQVTQILN